MVRQNPLTWSVPIVDQRGLPTQEFMRKWALQTQINASIIDLSTAAAVSGVLDKLGAAQGDLLYRAVTSWTVLPPGTNGYLLQTGGAGANPVWASISAVLDGIGAAQGDILYRDTAAWKVLAPGTSGNVLQTGGAAANPSWVTPTVNLDSFGTTQGDILYRDAAVWKVLAPGTAGHILQTNGAGANPSWVTGPVGSTGNTYCNVNSFGGWVASATAFATKGLGILLNTTITIDQITAGLATTSGHVYQAGVYPVNASLVIQAGQQSVQVTAGSTATQDLVFTFGSPITLTAGQLYIIAVTDTSAASGTTVLNLLAGQSAHQPLWYNLPVTINANFNASRYTLASLAPVAGNTFVIGSGLSHAIALRAQV